MIQWQFLIQKEGDHDWLPLESPNVEILEGRYYLMAKSGHLGAEVDVQICHEYELDGVPQEVVQRRRQRTDRDGCLALFPLTYLPPGQWELQCRVAALDQTEPAPVQKLFLQVLAQDFELLSDWDISEEELAALSTRPESWDVERSPVAAAVMGQATSTVSLPPIPAEIVLRPLRLASVGDLPPLIYTSNHPPVPLSPQLPDFLSLEKDNLLAANAPSTTPPLDFLRRIARSTDRQTVYAAFESLAWRQRFWQTLHTLAQPADLEETTGLNVPSCA